MSARDPNLLVNYSSTSIKESDVVRRRNIEIDI